MKKSMTANEKKEFYKKEIDSIARSSFNDEQKILAKNIIDKAGEKELDAVYTFITQRVKLGFVYDAAPEVNHGCVALAEWNKKLSFEGDVLSDTEPARHKLIIGENYDALKNLLVVYKGQVDVIYIDPPYNTEKTKKEGNDYKDAVQSSKFIYRDKFKRTGYLNMMRERLSLARKLLKETGVIFISIDDNEQAYLKVLCDEVFGEENFVASAPRKTSSIIRVLSDSELQKIHDYVLIYGKRKEFTKLNKQKTGTKVFAYKDDNGEYLLSSLQNSGEAGTRDARPHLYFPIYQQKDGTLQLKKDKNTITEILPSKVSGKDGRWLWSKDKFIKDKDKLVVVNGKLFQKRYKSDFDTLDNYQAYKTWLDNFSNSEGSKELGNIVDKGIFDYPKPVALIKHLLKIATPSSNKAHEYPPPPSFLISLQALAPRGRRLWNSMRKTEETAVAFLLPITKTILRKKSLESGFIVW